MSLLSAIKNVAPTVIKGIMTSSLPGPGMIATPFKVLSAFNDIVNVVKAGSMKTPPSGQFPLALPSQSSSKATNPVSLFDRLKSLHQNMKKIQQAIQMLKELKDFGIQFFGGGKTTQQVQSTSQTGGTGTGGVSSNPIGSSGSSGTSGASGQPSATSGAPDLGGDMSSQWAMFNKMQQMQQAAQMFELAVKIAELKHQAAMSAIRGIRY